MINYFNLAAITEKVTEAVTDEVQTAVEESFNLMKTLKELFLAYGMDIIIGILIFLVGLYIARYVRNLSKRIMRKSNVDPSAIGFISQILYFLLLIIVAIAALGRIGVPTNSFVAAIGALGLAIGLALQNNLSNFASGILILIFKPFKVGDFIEAAGVSGSVNEIQIMNTILYSVDNRKIIIPNSKLTSENVVNFSSAIDRKIQLMIEVDYNSDYKKAIELIKAIFKEDPDIYDEPEPTVALREFGESGIKIFALPSVKNENYWNAYYRIMQRIKDDFDANGIQIPYPHRMLYMKHLDSDKN